MTATKRRIKILSLGDSNTGKSSLIKRYCERRFDKRNNSTIGLDYGSIEVNVGVGGKADDPSKAEPVYVDFWDVSGKEDYEIVRHECYRPVPCAILLVFDVLKKQSFDSLREWMKELKSFLHKTNVPVVLCGNKIDGIPRAVSKRDGVIFKEKHKLQSYFETSALEGSKVDEMFQSLFEFALQ